MLSSNKASHTNIAFQGTIVRCGALFVAFPFDVLKSMIQSGVHREYTSIRHISMLIRTQRLNVYNGFPGPLLHTAINGTIMFGAQSFATSWLEGINICGTINWWLSGMISGAIGGTVAVIPEQANNFNPYFTN